jgi:hypothetical protein
MFMLERLLAIRQGIVTVMADHTHFTRQQAKKLEFIEEDWDHCNILCNLLKPIHLATTVLCADKKVIISLIRPIIHSLIFKHLKINENENILMTNLKLLFHKSSQFVSKLEKILREKLILLKYLVY